MYNTNNFKRLFSVIYYYIKNFESNYKMIKNETYQRIRLPPVKKKRNLCIIHYSNFPLIWGLYKMNIFINIHLWKIALLVIWRFYNRKFYTLWPNTSKVFSKLICNKEQTRTINICKDIVCMSNAYVYLYFYDLNMYNFQGKTHWTDSA